MTTLFTLRGGFNQKFSPIKFDQGRQKWYNSICNKELHKQTQNRKKEVMYYVKKFIVNDVSRKPYVLTYPENYGRSG